MSLHIPPPESSAGVVWGCYKHNTSNNFQSTSWTAPSQRTQALWHACCCFLKIIIVFWWLLTWCYFYIICIVVACRYNLDAAILFSDILVIVEVRALSNQNVTSSLFQVSWMFILTVTLVWFGHTMWYNSSLSPPPFHCSRCIALLMTQ